MNGNSFGSLIESAFRPFLSELGFTFQSAHLGGRYYRATFIESRYTLIVTFEPGDEEVIVMLLTNGDDSLKAIDDSAIQKTRTPTNQKTERQGHPQNRKC